MPRAIPSVKTEAGWRGWDWEANEFDGQSDFSDDGQLYEPVDPTVYTGNSDATFIPPRGDHGPPVPRLKGDLPGTFDYLRRQGYAEEMHPRIHPRPKTVDVLRAVVSFENPAEPFPKGNDGTSRSNRRMHLRQRRELDTIGMREEDDAGDLPDFPSSSRTEVRSPTRTEVRSPTRTSTEALTRGNFTATVTGGAGAGNTSVTIRVPHSEAAYISDAGATNYAANPYGAKTTEQARASAAFTFGTAGGKPPVSLAPGSGLTRGKAVTNGQYKLSMQTDGNLVLYKGSDPLWASNTVGRGDRAVMQTDGNFVVYQGSAPVWSSGTYGKPGAYLSLQSDGNLVVYQGGAPVWSTATWNGVHAGDHDSNVLKSIGSAVSSVGSAAGSVAMGIARPIGGLITSPIHLISDVATGKNVLASLKDTVKRDLGSVGEIAPYAQAVLSVVPGVGTGINAAIAAGAALAHGQNITDALVAGVKGMMPGGPLAQQALETAYKIAKGQNVIASVAEAARSQIPGGDLAKRAFDVGIALAHGANVQETLVSQGKDLAGSALNYVKEKAMSSISDLSPINARVLSNQGPQFIGQAVDQTIGLVPVQVTKVAQGILGNPALRGVPIESLASKFHVPVETARAAVASLVQSVQRAGEPSMAHMAPAVEVARRLSSNMNFDQAMSHFASAVGPARYSPNAPVNGMSRPLSGRPRPVAMHWVRTGAGYTPIIAEASGLDAGGTAYLVESGDSMSKIASKLTGSSARVGELIAANPQVKNPNAIQVKQRLNLPASWQTKAAVPTAAPPITTSVSPNAAPAPMPTFPTPVAPAIVAQQLPIISEKAKSSGTAVRAWQNILIRDGNAPAGTADGAFGPQTTSATKSWQTAHGLAADGAVGPKTWSVALATLPAVLTPSATPGAPPSIPGVPSLPTPGTTIQTPLGPVTLPQLPASIPTPMGPITLPSSIPTPMGPVATLPAPPAPASAPPTVMAENPLGVPQVTPTYVPPGTSPPWGGPPTLALPPGPTPGTVAPSVPGVTSTQIPGGQVTATQQPGGVVSVTQPPITDAPGGTGSPSGLGPLAVVAIIVGGAVLLGSTGKGW